jgi:hypothetical protein
LGDPDKDVAISCSSWFVARLCDQKYFASSHHNINKLNVSHLDPQFTGVCHLLIKINRICIRGFDNDPALLSQFFEPFVSMKKFLSVKENKQVLINFFADFIVKFKQSNPLVPPGNLYYIAGSFGNPEA